MKYYEKLADPRWQKKRLEIFNRDNFTCLVCDDNKSTLHVHHCYYVSKRDPWEYPNQALLTFCAKCHQNVDYDPQEEHSPSGYFSNQFEEAVILEMETIISNKNLLGISNSETISSLLLHRAMVENVPVAELANMLIACLQFGKLPTSALRRMSQEAIKEGYIR